MSNIKIKLLKLYFYSSFLQRYFTPCEVCGKIRMKNNVVERVYYGIPGLKSGTKSSMTSRSRMCGKCHKGFIKVMKQTYGTTGNTTTV